ncbi:N-acetylmuramoyl-L-alanine amidase family protein [Desulfitibacter alkalitolerans]|uniref:N-acetylmuramoyl-L-alanine amidase family protein n=1 Tax=Desulfitibacter alkalitolerans TaxID=264641 RepID=UPI00146F94E9|nr:N-acetylmuramoyl-L-alanine amidase [Desulfitibacter alkalitolerans]
MSYKTIVIDPGHGGTDHGTSFGSIREKDLVLDISLKLRQELAKTGYNVVMTRDRDVSITPAVRIGIIKNSGAALCISNHINAGGGRGTEIIQSIHSNGRLAAILLEKIVETGMTRRRIYSRESTMFPGQDYYYIIRDAKPVETVIVEYGFIDNEEDRRRLIQERLRLELAKAVSSGIDLYLKDMHVVIVDLDGQSKSFPGDKKQLINGRWYLEARAFTEMAGGRVTWDSQEQKAVFDFSRK